ncbi:hypothetical protein NC653_030632 [Populus alba x Populus x berolinensis]|uniref:Uncharacterized protein n=1 Tax=Populus alba x Populus x berolinensis TaxID=444605 RepID=A0AAD6LXL4_9ROSI|nr:hypothetical protein NC653_030632 [Populus alba x Populus x berolinensis]
MQGDEVLSNQTKKSKISNTSTLKTGRKRFAEQHLIRISQIKKIIKVKTRVDLAARKGHNPIFILVPKMQTSLN